MASSSPGEALLPALIRARGMKFQNHEDGTVTPTAGATSLATADLPSEYRVPWQRPGQESLVAGVLRPFEVFALGDGSSLPGGPRRCGT